MNLRNSFLILLCLFSFTASAITIGRNGGGLPEMQIVSVTNDIQQYLEVCLQMGPACKLSPEYIELVKKASVRLQNQKVKVSYRFDMAEAFAWSEKGDAVTFNQAYLYRADGTAKNESEILRLSFAAILFFEMGQDSKRLPELLSNIQKWNLPFESQKRSLVLKELDGLAHIITLSDVNLHDSVLIEGERATLDLGPMITNQIGSSSWKIKNASWDSLYLILTVEYQASGKIWRSDVVVILNSNKDKGMIEVSKLRVINAVELGLAPQGRDIIWPTSIAVQRCSNIWDL